MTAFNYFSSIDISHDVVFQQQRPHALYIGKGGDIMLTGADGETVRFNCRSGQHLAVAPSGIIAEGTTVGDVVALFTAW